MKLTDITLESLVKNRPDLIDQIVRLEGYSTRRESGSGLMRELLSTFEATFKGQTKVLEKINAVIAKVFGVGKFIDSGNESIADAKESFLERFKEACTDEKTIY